VPVYVSFIGAVWKKRKEAFVILQSNRALWLVWHEAVTDLTSHMSGRHLVRQSWSVPVHSSEQHGFIVLTGEAAASDQLGPLVSERHGSVSPTAEAAASDQLGPRVEYFLHKTLGDLRTSEMFEIILDCDESEPALSDLQVQLCALVCCTALLPRGYVRLTGMCLTCSYQLTWCFLEMSGLQIWYTCVWCSYHVNALWIRPA
jgi:hypothetical protein